ncbi:MAG TPA: GTP-binding protein [Solirubrobacteraceae bacterium]|jgi:G3E family GTPase|nr:GTP-binding protein [Solirubrobacteraceae bacterium]
MASRPEILLTVIGGYLGAGKTTLLNHVLRDAGDRRLAVLVNDFGAINIDAELVQSREGEMLSLTNGCICCGIGGDFIAALARLRDVDEPPEQVVVEASGVADPAQIAIFGDMPGYRRDAVVVVVDAETVRSRAADEFTGHQVLRQLRAADLLVVNKVDLVQAAAVVELRTWLRDIAGPSTGIVDAAFGDVPVDVLIGARHAMTVRDARTPAAHDRDGHAHPDYETWSWSAAAPLSGSGLVAWLQALPDGVVRAKGLLHLREDAANRYLLQAVGRRYGIEAQGPWRDEAPASRIVVIGLPGSVDANAFDDAMADLTGVERAAR